MVCDPAKLTANEASGPGVPLALKLTGEPEQPAQVADSALAPAMVPSIQEPTAAMPEESVVASPPVTDPPPLCTLNVTAASGTGLP